MGQPKKIIYAHYSLTILKFKVVALILSLSNLLHIELILKLIYTIYIYLYNNIVH